MLSVLVLSDGSLEKGGRRQETGGTLATGCSVRGCDDVGFHTRHSTPDFSAQKIYSALRVGITGVPMGGRSVGKGPRAQQDCAPT